MSLRITKTGLCDTIQDEGRKGYAAFGINPSGAMDLLAMNTANALAGNKAGTPLLEMHFPACSIVCTTAVFAGMSGADFDAVIQTTAGIDLPLSSGRSFLLPAGSKLNFRGKKRGERCYLAIHGGLDLPPWFGSCSTNLKIGKGGFHGRKLGAGDELPLKKHLAAEHITARVFPWFANTQSWYQDPLQFSVLAGPEWDWLEPASKNYFLKNPFTIAAHSDRMGISLQGVPLQQLDNEQLLSSGVNFGTIQLLPNGQLIILAADHPTTGGYPRIAHIVSTDLPKLSQTPPGSRISFIKTNTGHAEQMLAMQQKELVQIEQAIRFNLSTLVL